MNWLWENIFDDSFETPGELVKINCALDELSEGILAIIFR